MSRPRRRFATGPHDGNCAEIVAAYEELGCSVHNCSGLGFGFPDLVVGLVGITELVEVKMSDGELEESQKTFIRDWRGSKVRIVRCRNDVFVHVMDVRARVSGRRSMVAREPVAMWEGEGQ